MARKHVGLLLGAALVGAIVAGVLALRPGDGDAARQSVEAQLLSAYPAERSASGAIQEFDITAAASVVALADDVLVDVWAYNGSVPGPELRVTLGETVVVNLYNDLPQATSIHWHGVRVPNAMDGVPGVNQNAVMPGDSFRYEFVPKDPGTFWFHSHNRGSEQIERGLYGSLVVVDPSEPAYDSDLIWVIDDWLLDGDGSLVEDFNEPHDTSHNGRWGNVVTTNGRVNPTVDVRPGERLRIRLVNASNARVVAPRFAGLAPTVIAVDGMLAREPSAGDGFVLAPGNRVDLDVTVPSQVGTVVVHENFNGEGFVLATLNVTGEPVDPPAFRPPTNPEIPSAVDTAVSVDHEYSLDFLPAPMAPQWGFNGRSYADTDTFTAESGELQTIRLSNESQMLHPIHFHGQFFKVLAIDGELADEPFLRDTVLVYPGETIDIAMVPVDLGVWAVHCHIQEHAEAGMMTLLEVIA